MPGTRELLKVLDQQEEQAIDTCTTCPKLCRWTCPVAEAEARETTSPWNLMVMSGFLKRGAISVDAVGHEPYHCTSCGACTELCHHDVDVGLWMSLARARLIAGHSTPAAVNELRGHFGTAQNPEGVPLMPVLEKITDRMGDDAPDRHSLAAASGAVTYFPGCSTLTQRPEAAESFLRALTLNGIGGVAITEASAGCCGLPLLWAGDVAGFKAHAERHAARLSSVDTLIVHDAACGHAMRDRYPVFGVHMSPEIVHVSSFLAGRLTEFAHAPQFPEKSCAYLDTCGMRRGIQVEDAPRRLIQQLTGAPPVEVPSVGGGILDCCGAAGLLPQSAPDTARAMGQARIDAFRKSGAATLVSFSPRCSAHLAAIDPSLPLVDGSSLFSRV